MLINCVHYLNLAPAINHGMNTKLPNENDLTEVEDIPL